MQEAVPLEKGTLLGGKYRVVRVIGAGGMGFVYEATLEPLGRPVALKVVRADADADTEALARLEREARAAAKLDHPNVVGVTDFSEGDASEPAFLAMDLLHGESLADRIERLGPLGEDEVVATALQVADGLVAAHAAGLVHRDLKPSNLFLTPLGSGGFLAKILDFGIVHRVEETGAKLTQRGMVVGTPAYMSPERIRMEPVDARCDVYAVGACLYESLTGRPPYDGDMPMTVALEVLRSPPPDVQMLRPGVSEALAAVVRRAMARELGERVQTASELRDALAEVRAGAERKGVRAVDTGAAVAKTLLALPSVGVPVQIAPLGVAPAASTTSETMAFGSAETLPPPAPVKPVDVTPAMTAVHSVQPSLPSTGSALAPSRGLSALAVAGLVVLALGLVGGLAAATYAGLAASRVRPATPTATTPPARAPVVEAAPTEPSKVIPPAAIEVAPTEPTVPEVPAVTASVPTEVEREEVSSPRSPRGGRARREPTERAPSEPAADEPAPAQQAPRRGQITYEILDPFSAQ